MRASDLPPVEIRFSSTSSRLTFPRQFQYRSRRRKPASGAGSDARPTSHPEKHEDRPGGAGGGGYRCSNSVAFAAGGVDRIAAAGTGSTVERITDEDPPGGAAQQSAGKGAYRERADRRFL